MSQYEYFCLLPVKSMPHSKVYPLDIVRKNQLRTEYITDNYNWISIAAATIF